MTAEDWLLSFDYGLPNVACCRKLTLAAFSANGRSTSEHRNLTFAGRVEENRVR